jgi:hypothetical protein
MRDTQTRSKIRWYAGAVVLSVLAVICGLISFFSPRVGYPLTFAFTMACVLTYTMPAWDRPEGRPKLVVANVAALLMQVTILYFGLAGAV